MFTLSRRNAGVLASVLFAALLIGACSLDPTVASRAALSAADALCYTCPPPTPTPPPTATTSGFVILGASATPLTDPIGVTLTDSVVTGGDVGAGIALGTVVQTNSTVTLPGIVHSPADDASIAAYNAIFNPQGLDPASITGGIYDTIGHTVHPVRPTNMLPAAPPASFTLRPGVYFSEAAVTFSTITLTLDARNDPNAQWIFLIGTLGTGALTGTNFNVVLANGAQACNVTWWVAEAATMTTSNFQGTILAGAAITLTGGTFNGNAFARAAVTLTGATLVGCETIAVPPAQSVSTKVTGGGWIELQGRDKGTFSVSAEYRRGDLRGQLEYEDHGDRGHRGHNTDGIKVKGTGVTQFVVTGVTSHIEGTAKVDGVAGFTYKVDATDNGEGRWGRRGHQSDTFAISVYGADGTLRYSSFGPTPAGRGSNGHVEGGNIQLHVAGDNGGHGWQDGWGQN